MANKASTTAPAKERKKPVRTAPVQKDYPNKLAWLKAMTEHEERETKAANKAKVANHRRKDRALKKTGGM